MMIKPAKRPVFARLARKAADYRSDEGGSIAIFIVFIFILMLLFGGIAVDVMRFEMRRVALQETLDRATLAAANVILPASQTPQSVVTEWFNKAGLGNELTVDYFAPTVGGVATTSSREAWARAKVRSYNHFMGMLAKPYFEGDTVAVAQQGISTIEVMMVLDITGSMSQPSGSTIKISALRSAAANFVTILKYSKDTSGNYTINRDPNNLISIGLVPYAANVNIPKALRDQYTYTQLSSWDGVDNQGVKSPEINCLEIPQSTFGTAALSRTMPIPMAAVTDAWPSDPRKTGTTAATSSSGGVMTINATGSAPSVKKTGTDNVVCNHGDNAATTSVDESYSNLLTLPSTKIADLKTQIGQLNPRGRTSIAMGMRWGTALLDQSARDIYTALITEPEMAGRPGDNVYVPSSGKPETRKIIVLMTDGEHVESKNIVDAYKTGLSPIWRGADGNLVIRYTSGGPAKTDGLRPGLTATTNTCSGWVIPAGREFFAPHLKANSVKAKFKATDAEGLGSGTAAAVTGACDPRAWLSSTTGVPSWSGSGTARRLDWSEVWRFASADWVFEQLYMRSGVANTESYSALQTLFITSQLGTDTNMDALLDQICTAAKAPSVGIEVFGIVLGDAVDQVPIQKCASPGTGYYYWVKDAANLNAAFEQIAVLISDLKLTQ